MSCTPSNPRTAPHAGRILHRPFSAIAATLGIVALGACTSISPATKEQVAASEVAVQQSSETIGQAEAGAIELQKAKEHLQAAKKALANEREKDAQHRATQAQLHAELAVVKTQSAAARRSADEVLASVETLRQEAERNSPVVR